MAENPMATMVLGQAGAGAVSSYEARKDSEDRREHDDKVRRERGVMGVDYEGNYQGIVASQQVAPQQTVAQATTAPSVAAPAVRPVSRKNLPELQKQGLIAPQQVA